MILLIDHYDSFVETLARYLREAGAQTVVLKPDDRALDNELAKGPEAIILSPGPGRPAETPRIQTIFDAFSTTPILGVCLGHQAMCEAYGGQTVPAPRPMHGRASLIHHQDHPLFEGLGNPFRAGRYHSLLGAIGPDSDLDEIAFTDDGTSSSTLMAVAHRNRPHFGVQFHPESLLTDGGRCLLQNFLKTTKPER